MRSPLGNPTHCAWIPITVKHLFSLFSTFRLDKLGDLRLKLNPHECSGPGPEVLLCW